MSLQRIYVTEESYERLKKAKERYDEALCDLAEEATFGLFGRDGTRKEAFLNEESKKSLLDMSEETGVSPNKLILMLIGTMRTLFNPNLSFASMIKSLPDIADELYKKEKE